MSIIHFAYLDFSTGSVIVQAIVGAAAGVALFGRRMIAAAKYKLGFGRKSDDELDDIEEKATTHTKKKATKK